MPAALPSATRATSPSRRLLGLGLGLAVSLALAACPGDDGDGDCGPGATPPDGLRVFGDGFEARYTMLQAGANNDCPDPNAPAGVISLTIAGIQDGIEPGLITLCVPRPDLFDQATPARDRRPAGRPSSPARPAARSTSRRRRRSAPPRPAACVTTAPIRPASR
jgi:hypothetical protein